MSDQATTKMVDTCTLYGCKGSVVKSKSGFQECQKCGASYGTSEDLPAIEGGVATEVSEQDGRIVYKYRVPPEVYERHRQAALANAHDDPEDIGQGEGCEGGKCAVPEKK